MILLFPQAGPYRGIDLSQSIAAVETALNAAGASDLVEWEESDLYEWADEAAKRLARGFSVFVERDTSNAITLGTASYPVPRGHVSTIHVAAGGVALTASNVQEIEALDAAWPAAQGACASFLMDTDGTLEVTLYPAPDATVTGAVDMIFAQFPATISAAATLLYIPSPIRDYFTWYVLAEARRRQSDAAMPEVSAALDARFVGLMEKVIEQYWGAAQ